MSFWVDIKGSKALIGCDLKLGHPDDQEGPPVSVTITDFTICSTTVSNEEFSIFVEETGYVTDAERFGNSFVFKGLIEKPTEEGACCSTELPWWTLMEGASWRAPLGPGSDLDGLLNHPVTHVTFDDALAYCRWSDTRLPNEIEWEYAARGGKEGHIFPWGNVLVDDEIHANTFKGNFPFYTEAESKKVGTTPVQTYKPNDFGLFQMIGNVWEWQINMGRIHLDELKKQYESGTSFDKEAMNRAVRGGSFLCHESYCNRYRSCARNQMMRDTSASNVGFRVVKTKVI